MRYLISLACLSLGLSAAHADFVQKTVNYTDGTIDYSGVLIYNDELDADAPGIFMVPNWMGVTEGSIEKAKMIAGDKYVIFVADMYGVNIRPKNATEAGDAASFVRADRSLMRARAALGLETFLAQEAPLNQEHVAAIGFCFGGGSVLELGRTGAELDAIVSFHGDLISPTLAEDAGQTKAQVLVLHGAADPFVPQSDVQAFIDAMLATDVDWELVQYSGTVHSFTDPTANMEGKAQYNAISAGRAFERMEALLDELWN